MISSLEDKINDFSKRKQRGSGTKPLLSIYPLELRRLTGLLCRRSVRTCYGVKSALSRVFNAPGRIDGRKVMDFRIRGSLLDPQGLCDRLGAIEVSCVAPDTPRAPQAPLHP